MEVSSGASEVNKWCTYMHKVQYPQSRLQNETLVNLFKPVIVELVHFQGLSGFQELHVKRFVPAINKVDQ